MPNNQYFNTGGLAVYRLAKKAPRYERHLRANLARRVRLEIASTFVAAGAYIFGLLLAAIGFSNDLKVAGMIGATLVVIGLVAMILYKIVSVGVQRIDKWQEKLKAGELRDVYVTSNDPSYEIAFAEHGELRNHIYQTGFFLKNAVVIETDQKLHDKIELDLEWINEHYELKQLLVAVARSCFGDSAALQSFDKETEREKTDLIGQAKAAHRAEMEQQELALQKKRNELQALLDQAIAEFNAAMGPIRERGRQFSKI